MYVHGRRLSNGEQVATMAAYVGLVSVIGLGLLAARGEVGSAALGRSPGCHPARWPVSPWAAGGRPGSTPTSTASPLLPGSDGPVDGSAGEPGLDLEWRSLMTDDTSTTAATTGGVPLAGVIPIPVTTFHDDGGLDTEGLASQVRFSHDSGAHGVLYRRCQRVLHADRRRTAHGGRDGRHGGGRARPDHCRGHRREYRVGGGLRRARPLGGRRRGDDNGADVQHFFSPITDFARVT